MTEFFGTTNIVTALGLRSLSLGLFSAAAPPIVGLIVDATGSYKSPFFASSVLSLVSAISILIVKKIIPPKISSERDQIGLEVRDVDREIQSPRYGTKEEHARTDS